MDGLNMALALPTVGQISVYVLRRTLVCFLKHWSGSGAETGAKRAENMVSEAMSGCKNNHWSGSGVGAECERSGAKAGSGSGAGAERSAEVTEIGLSGEQEICRSRSAHMLCL